MAEGNVDEDIDVNLADVCCSMDDPILWGILPLSYMFNPDNLRWGLGSYDLCFTNKCVAGHIHAHHTDTNT